MALHEKKKTAHMLIPSVRFVGKDGREIFGMPIPDALLTNEIKGAPYYSEYQEHVTKYQQYLDAERGQTEEGGATESPKATRVTKPKAAKAGLEGKRCKVKSPLKLVDEPSDECVLGPSRPVILRERDFGKFQPLPERRTHMPIEPSGYAESPSLDAEPALTDSEMESNKEVPEINAGNQDEARRDQTLVYKMKARLNQTLVYKMKARLDQTLVYKMKARLDQTLVMLQSLNLNQVMWLFSSLPGVLTPVRGESLKILNGFDVSLPVSHSLWSSQSFGHQKAINGFDMPLPVAVCSGLVNPLAPRKGKFHGGLMTMSTLCT
ncbi:hypothetical protein Tco_1103490 [Tanacetum coccineum]